MTTLSPAQLERNKMAAVKHGAHSTLQLAPRAEAIAESLRTIVPVQSLSDEPTIRLAAMALAQVEAASTWLDANGFVDSQGNPQGVLKVLAGFMNTASRLLAALGCSPVSRASLGLDLARFEELTSRVDLSVLTNEELAQYRILAAKTERREAE